MLSSLISFFTTVLKTKSVLELVYRAAVISMLVTWIAFSYVVATNFSTILGIYMTATNKDTQLVERDARNVARIQEILRTTILTEPSIDRIYMDTFHDTVQDLSGIHYVFSSRRVELDKTGIANLVVKNQNIPSAVFPDMMKNFANGECWIKADTSDTSSSGEFLLTYGVTSAIRCPIHDPQNDQVIGYIGVEKVVGHFTQDEFDRITMKLKIPAIRIEEIIISSTKLEGTSP